MSTPEGYVAATSANRRTLLHLAAPPFGARTLCNRYDVTRYLPPEDSRADARTPKCEVCMAMASGTHGQAKAK